MTLRRNVITSKGAVVEINSDDENLIRHFDDPVNYADIVLDQINNDRFYENIFKKDDMVILDIGANIGLFTLFAQDRAKAIYPIEPTPSHFKILTDLTKNYPNVHPLNLAISDRSGKIDFYIHEDNTTTNSINNRSGNRIEVDTKTILRTITDLGLSHIDFIKCDIEGSEVVALNDKTVYEVKDLVDSWFVEVHATDHSTHWEISSYANLYKMSQLFLRNGYSIRWYKTSPLNPHVFDGIYAFKS